MDADKDNEHFLANFNPINRYYLEARPGKIAKIMESRNTPARRNFMDQQKQNIVTLQAAYWHIFTLLSRDERFRRDLEQIRALWEPFKSIDPRVAFDFGTINLCCSGF